MRLYFLSIFSFAGAECMHLLNHYYHLYSIYPQMDNVAHFLSGMGIGLFLMAAHRREWSVVLWGFLIAVIWEIVEAAANVTGYVLFTLPYYIDTLKDICVGVAGTIVAIYIARAVLRHIALLKETNK